MSQLALPGSAQELLSAAHAGHPLDRQGECAPGGASACADAPNGSPAWHVHPSPKHSWPSFRLGAALTTPWRRAQGSPAPQTLLLLKARELLLDLPLSLGGFAPPHQLPQNRVAVRTASTSIQALPSLCPPSVFRRWCYGKLARLSCVAFGVAGHATQRTHAEHSAGEQGQPMHSMPWTVPLQVQAPTLVHVSAAPGSGSVPCVCSTAQQHAPHLLRIMASRPTSCATPQVQQRLVEVMRGECSSWGHS